MIYDGGCHCYRCPHLFKNKKGDNTSHYKLFGHKEDNEREKFEECIYLSDSIYIFGFLLNNENEWYSLWIYDQNVMSFMYQSFRLPKSIADNIPKALDRINNLKVFL